MKRVTNEKIKNILNKQQQAHKVQAIEDIILVSNNR